MDINLSVIEYLLKERMYLKLGMFIVDNFKISENNFIKRILKVEVDVVIEKE